MKEVWETRVQKARVQGTRRAKNAKKLAISEAHSTRLGLQSQSIDNNASFNVTDPPSDDDSEGGSDQSNIDNADDPNRIDECNYGDDGNNNNDYNDSFSHDHHDEHDIRDDHDERNVHDIPDVQNNLDEHDIRDDHDERNIHDIPDVQNNLDEHNRDGRNDSGHDSINSNGAAESSVHESLDQEETSVPLLGSPPVTIDDDSAPTHATRSGRTRKRRHFEEELSVCLCGHQVSAEERLDSSIRPAIKCRYVGCETQWFHLECVNLEFTPKYWDCGVHGEELRSKRGRRD